MAEVQGNKKGMDRGDKTPKKYLSNNIWKFKIKSISLHPLWKQGNVHRHTYNRQHKALGT